jgi:heptosyltransferase II
VCASIASQVGGSGLTNLCGRLSILESAALIAECTVVLANDSAAMHMAAAMGTRSVVILGPTVREFGFVPPEPTCTSVEVNALWCRPCTPFGGARCPTGKFECMEGIGVAEVLGAVLKQIEEQAVR